MNLRHILIVTSLCATTASLSIATATGLEERTFEITRQYLHLPVAEEGGDRQVMRVYSDGEVVRQFHITLTETPDFWVASDVSKWHGQEITLRLGGEPNSGMHLIRQDDEMPGADRMYNEKHRPQFHFTSRRGWLNDPNGLVYYDGEWHLFYQHNPYEWRWGNMHWGHAISTDLFHWKEQGNVFHPAGEDTRGDAFSGSAVVDHDNTTGWRTGNEDVIVAAFTDTGSGEVVAYSNDRGRSFTLYEGNPVVKHNGRDPKIIWHDPTERWVMAVYEHLDNKRWISFHTSPNLKNWTFQSRIEGFYECPDLFELSIDGDESDTRWVLYGADAKYMIGHFDGKEFTPEHEGKHQVWHGNYYAAQTYDNAPDGRRVQIGWAREVTFPGMPFNQQMAVPVDLTLRSTDAGPRMFAEPVKELANIRSRSHRFDARQLAPGDANPTEDILAELLELDVTFEPGDNGRLVFNIRGVLVTYHAESAEVETAGTRVPLEPVEGQVRLQILVDRGSVECFGNGGRVAISQKAKTAPDSRHVHVRAENAPVRIREMNIHELKSIWQ